MKSQKTRAIQNYIIILLLSLFLVQAKVYAMDGITITVQPNNVEQKIGAPFEVLTEAEGEGTLRYQWQYRLPNGNWTEWPGMTSNTLAADMQANYVNVEVRCDVKDANGKETFTDVAVINAIQPEAPKILRQPIGVEQKIGRPFKVVTEAEGEGTLRYQWQYRLPNGNWTEWPGMTSNTLAADMQANYVNVEVRCDVKDANGKETFTDVAVINAIVPPAPIVLKQPKSGDALVGNSVLMETEADGDGEYLNYQWQYKYTDTDWVDWPGYTEKRVYMTMYDGYVNLMTRCRISNNYGGVTYTDAVSIEAIKQPCFTVNVGMLDKSESPLYMPESSDYTLNYNGNSDVLVCWLYSYDGFTYNAIDDMDYGSMKIISPTKYIAGKSVYYKVKIKTANDNIYESESINVIQCDEDELPIIN